MRRFFELPGGRIKRFRNRQSRCHHCGKRRHGRPACGHGLCHAGTANPHRRVRAAVRRQLAAWTRD